MTTTAVLAEYTSDSNVGCKARCKDAGYCRAYSFSTLDESCKLYTSKDVGNLVADQVNVTTYIPDCLSKLMIFI